MFRQLEVRDCKEVIRLLFQEDPSIKKHYLFEGDTWIFEEKNIIKGFFTLNLFNKFPMLQHFVVENKKDIPLIYKIIRKVKERSKELGYDKLIYHAPINKPKVAQILAYYTRKRPYKTTDKAYFFISGV